jgi:hypothetical protein
MEDVKLKNLKNAERRLVKKDANELGNTIHMAAPSQSKSKMTKTIKMFKI